MAARLEPNHAAMAPNNVTIRTHKQHGPFVIAPCSADLIQHRLGRMAVHDHHDRQRKIRGHKGPGQRAEGEKLSAGIARLAAGSATAIQFPWPSAFFAAPTMWHHHLRHIATMKGENQGKMSKLGNHRLYAYRRSGAARPMASCTGSQSQAACVSGPAQCLPVLQSSGIVIAG